MLLTVSEIFMVTLLAERERIMPEIVAGRYPPVHRSGVHR